VLQYLNGQIRAEVTTGIVPDFVMGDTTCAIQVCVCVCVWCVYECVNMFV
jgi:hypothetical protein